MEPLKTFLRRFIVDTIPASVRQDVMALPAETRERFLARYQRRARSTGAAYFVCLLVGGQYAYVGRWGVQLLFWVSLGGLLIWWVVDLFRVAGMVRRHNERVARDILRALAA